MSALRFDPNLIPTAELERQRERRGEVRFGPVQVQWLDAYQRLSLRLAGPRVASRPPSAGRVSITDGSSGAQLRHVGDDDFIAGSDVRRFFADVAKQPTAQADGQRGGRCLLVVDGRSQHVFALFDRGDIGLLENDGGSSIVDVGFRLPKCLTGIRFQRETHLAFQARSDRCRKARALVEHVRGARDV